MATIATMAVLQERAQCMCDNDGRTRWVNYTSLGWRIERAPLADSWQVIAGISIEVTPAKREG